MTERDLENLSKLPVPAPRTEAKRAALAAAMTAFDQATPSALPAGSPLGESEAQTKDSLPAGSPLGEPEAQIKNSSQGNVVPLGQTETPSKKRSFPMRLLSRLNSKQNMALAASVAALMIAAPYALHQIRGDLNQTFTQVSTELQTANGGRSYDVPSAPPLDARTRGDASVRVTPATPAPAERKVLDGLVEGYASTPQEPASADAPAAKPAELTSKQVTIARLGDESAREQRAAAAPPAPAAEDSARYAQGGRVVIQGDQSFNASGVNRIEIGPSTIGGASQFEFKSDGGVTVTNPDAKKKAEGAQAWMGGEADADLKTVQQIQEENRDHFEATPVNPVKQVANEPVSTFSIDVDTASYAFVRRALNAGRLPPKDAVRVEEMINYFPYAYPAPETAETPFKPSVTVVASPWNPRNKLVHVAIKGYDLKSAERPRANLVFLLDVSGSMGPQDRLPLVKNAFRLLLDQLKPDDTVGIVTYASGSGIALEPTRVADKGKILSAIDALGAGGSTAGAAGIADAYRLAEAGFDRSAVNRVILATDGDFNVGITNQDELKGFIERKRQSGIFLSILGVGQGNHNDALMQTLAQNGNGTAAYVDTLSEARKVLVDESSSTLFTIAKDVKIQIEWNPQAVSEYRLIGYETRNLRREDFNNDRVDAGDIGSGHTVTAIYEVTPVGAPKMIDDLRYGAPQPATVTAPRSASEVAANSELGFLKLRYKRPREETSQLVSLPITNAERTHLDAAPADVRFSIAAAAFGQMLKGEPYTQGYSYDDVLALAQGARGDDPFGYRAEFLNLVRLAKSARP